MLKVFREGQRQTNENSQNSSVWFLKSRHKNDPEAPNTSTPTTGGVQSRHLVIHQSPGATSPQSFPCLVCAGLCGRPGVGGVCEENTKIPLLKGHSVYVCDGEGRAVRILRRSTNKASQLTLYYL